MVNKNGSESQTYMKTNLIIIIIVFLNLHFCKSQNSPKITVEQGEIEGLELQSRDGNTYYAYLGVPYGKQPVRFEAAEFPDNWEGVKPTKAFGNMCPQHGEGDEDCLFANVMTPKLDQNLPVMVFIHGGGFMFTSANDFGAKYWMDAEVILVTFNYRLNVFGFLSTGDEVIQGNYGLKDQALCLRWIQNNIAKFGGDPNRVAIFGESAGGASVNYHIISPMSKGLFSTAISQSGAAINPWAFQFNPIKQVNKLAQYLNCPTDTSTVIKNCLMLKSTADIAAAVAKFEVWKGHPLYSFAPSVEKVGNGQQNSVFLSDNPFRLMSEGKVNPNLTWVTGVNDAEGIFYVGSVTNVEGFQDDIKGNSSLLPVIFFYEDSVVSLETKTFITNEIWDFYFGSSENIEVANMSNFFGDRFFNFGVLEAAKLYSHHGTVYPYVFTKLGNFSWGQEYFGPNDLIGATHCDELNWQFVVTFGDVTAPEFDAGSEYEIFSKNFVNLWASIAANGKPNRTWGPEEVWHPIENTQTIKWYKIDDSTSSIDFPFESRMQFWNQLKMNEWNMDDEPNSASKITGAQVLFTISLLIVSFFRE